MHSVIIDGVEYIPASKIVDVHIDFAKQIKNVLLDQMDKIEALTADVKKEQETKKEAAKPKMAPLSYFLDGVKYPQSILLKWDHWKDGETFTPIKKDSDGWWLGVDQDGDTCKYPEDNNDDCWLQLNPEPLQ